MKRPWFLILALLSLSACRTTTVGSTSLARETLTQVVEYDTSVRALDAALRAAREEALANATNSALTQIGVVEESARRTLAVTFADRAIDGGVSPAAFRQFVAQSAEAGQAESQRLTDALAVVAAKSRADSAKLDAMEKELRVVRQRLERLQRPSSNREDIEAYRVLVKAAREAIKKAQEEAQQ